MEFPTLEFLGVKMRQPVAFHREEYRTSTAWELLAQLARVVTLRGFMPCSQRALSPLFPGYCMVVSRRIVIAGSERRASIDINNN